MKRPSFQFYPADLRNNAKLRRCSWAARGAWIEVMGLFHDSDEYGLLRWPLKEIAQALGCPLALLKELAEKGVLKGSDRGVIPAYTYAPTSGRKQGPPVILIAEQEGPMWYCSRMVRDEYVRQKKANHELYKDSPNYSPEPPPNHSPMPPIGEGIDAAPMAAPMPPKSDLPTSSSSSSSKNLKAKSKTLSGKPDGVEVLDYLNELANRTYQPVSSNLGLISARLAEGATIDQCKAVVSAKVAEWGADPKMEKYLRPKTLFSATNFAQYVGGLGRQNAPSENHGPQPSEYCDLRNGIWVDRRFAGSK
jgi:uncharacterized phage protein (TIGR02220 family)